MFKFSLFFKAKALIGLIVFLVVFSPILSLYANAAEQIVYKDALLAGWENWSWGIKTNFLAKDVVYEGQQAIFAQYTTKWGGLYFHSDEGVNTATYDTLTFMINGGEKGHQNLGILVYLDSDTPHFDGSLTPYIQGGNILPKTWHKVTIPVSALNSSNKTIHGIAIQGASGLIEPIFYVDLVQFTGSLVPPPPPPTPTEKRGKISIAFDDGLSSTYGVAAPFMAKYNIPGTVYVYPQAQDQQFIGFMTWNQVQDLQNTYKWEVSAHSYTHAHLTKISVADMQKEFSLADASLKNHGITPPGFASPYGEYNDAVITETKKYYEYHRNAFGGVFNTAPYNAYNLNGVDVSGATSPADVKALVDKAITQDTWLIIYFHDLVNGTPPPYSYNIDKFKEIITYIASKPTNVMTVIDVLHKPVPAPVLGANLVPNGDFEQGTGEDADSWTRNNTTQVKVVTQGDRTVRILGSATQNQITTLPFAIDSSKIYRFEAFSDISNFVSGSGNVWVSEFNASNAYIGGKWLGGVNSNGTGTQKFDYTPNTNTKTIELFIYSWAGSNFTWQVDDVSLRSVN